MDGCDWLFKYERLINFSASGGRLTSVTNSSKLHSKFCNMPTEMFKVVDTNVLLRCDSVLLFKSGFSVDSKRPNCLEALRSKVPPIGQQK